MVYDFTVRFDVTAHRRQARRRSTTRDAHEPTPGATYRISELAALCGVSPRTIDYYTRRGLLEPSERSRGRQRRYGEAAIQQLLRIKELQSERLTLREITQRLATGATSSSEGLTAQVQALEDELERLNRSLASLTPRLQAARDPAERQAVSQVAGLALAKSLALAQWLAAIVRDGQTGV